MGTIEAGPKYIRIALSVGNTLRKQQEFENLTGVSDRINRPMPEEEQFLRAIFDIPDPTRKAPEPIARSELTVTEEELKGLRDKLGQVRDWMLEHGQNIVEMTDDTGIEGLADTLGEDEVMFFHRIGPMLTYVTTQEGQFRELHFGIDDVRVTIDADVNGYGARFTDYSCTISFMGDKDSEGRFIRQYQNEKPLEQMTPDEHSIFSSIADTFIQQLPSE